MKSILDIEVSCFKNLYSVDAPKTVNLLKWLTSSKYADQIAQVRAAKEKSARDELKKKLPVITPSGIFTKRHANALVKHTGLLSIDIDYDGRNKQISNWSNLKNEMAKIPNIAYFGLSASGNAYWGLIPIEANPNCHGEYFDCISELFSRIGLSLDPACRDVSRLRFYSYDPHAYFNQEAIPFQLPKKKLAVSESKKKVRANTYSQLNGFENQDNLKSRVISQIQRLIDEIIETPGHPRLRSAARLMGGYVGAGILSKSEALDILHHLIDSNGYLSQAKKVRGYKKTAWQALEHGIAYPISIPNTRKKPGVISWSHYLPSDCNRKATSLSVQNSDKQAYLMGLYFENNVLINRDGYPATWDTTKDCRLIDEKTKSFIMKIARYPELLEYVKTNN